jgi:hypothetical protein
MRSEQRIERGLKSTSSERPQNTSVLRRIAGRPAALPQNCLTTEDESRTVLAFRPRHFGNIYPLPNISFRSNHLHVSQLK